MEFLQLKELLLTDAWPAAVDSFLICDPNSETDKATRAEGIVELLIDESLKGKKFLDYGCGEGHVVYAAKESSISIGYDIQSHPNWKENITTDINEVKKHAPYDVILIYDVLDHTDSIEKAREVLSIAKELLDKKGTIYLRVHPFCSRHATHLYHQLNKAYLHLMFSLDELNQLGIEATDPGWKVYDPAVYSQLIEEVGLKVISSNMSREKAEDFFHLDIGEYQFMDYTLRKKSNIHIFPSFLKKKS